MLRTGARANILYAVYSVCITIVVKLGRDEKFQSNICTPHVLFTKRLVHTDLDKNKVALVYDNVKLGVIYTRQSIEQVFANP